MDREVHDFDFLIKGGPYSHIIEANGWRNYGVYRI
jgi:hypothetical protein